MIDLGPQQELRAGRELDPGSQIQVISAIQITPTIGTAKVESPRFQSNSRKVYLPAIWARVAITMTSVKMIAQPPIQPICGPNARVVHVNVVPQSGSARLRYCRRRR